jgi:hypothetical protein
VTEATGDKNVTYIVRRAYRTSQPGLHGWHSKVIELENLEQAEAAHAAPFTGTEFQSVLIQLDPWKVLGRRKK